MEFHGVNRSILPGVLALCAFAIGLAWLAGQLAERSLIGDLQRSLGSSLDVNASGLLGDLSDYPAALSMLASDPRILRAILSGDQEEIFSAQARLQRYADLSGVESAMIVDADGRLITDHDDDVVRSRALIAWLEQQPAFETALSSGFGRAFGGPEERIDRHYVFARRINNPDGRPALLIVTVTLDQTELLWSLSEQDILVVDQQGTVLLSSDRVRRFERLGTVSGSDATLQAAPYMACRQGAVKQPGEQICLAKPITRLGWEMYLLGALAPVWETVRLVQGVTALGVISLALLISVVRQRRLALYRTLQIKENANRLLQQRVDRRTGDLRHANQQLQAEIDERKANECALRAAQAELVQTSKLAALGQLSAGIAHQLNQPLAALRAYADNARTFLARGQIDPANDNLSLIGDLTERIGKITKDLKVFARRQPTRTEPVALSPLIRSVIDQIEKANPTGAIEIGYDDVPAAPLAEPVGLQQVIANLIQNGIDAMDTVDNKEPRAISITTALEGDHVMLAVNDRGTGIDPEIMDNIFDPFFTTKEVGKGLGLGLSLSASIIQDMGGRLTAANRDGGGACFTVELKHGDSVSPAT